MKELNTIMQKALRGNLKHEKIEELIIFFRNTWIDQYKNDFIDDLREIQRTTKTDKLASAVGGLVSGYKKSYLKYIRLIILKDILLINNFQIYTLTFLKYIEKSLFGKFGGFDLYLKYMTIKPKDKKIFYELKDRFNAIDKSKHSILISNYDKEDKIIYQVIQDWKILA